MSKFSTNIHPIVFLIIATALEVVGDAIIRTSIYNYTGTARIGLFVVGTLFLFGYGFSLNLAPVEFAQVAGLYISTLFVMWQVVNYFAFHTVPTLPIMVGGSMIVIGGLIVTFWKQS